MGFQPLGFRHEFQHWQIIQNYLLSRVEILFASKSTEM
jgi:hypothetical protein